ncbi:Aldo/keto reductase [Trametes gibbosa]|nr:Aldo/keto reductase [Trametes gibbosa]
MSSSVPTRRIGAAEVSAIGYGTMTIARSYTTTTSEDERMKILDAAYESGCTFWDTADLYTGSEAAIGEWFKRTGKRDEIFLATKFGLGAGIPGRLVCGDPEADPTVPIELTVGAMAEQVKAGKVKYIGLSEVSAATLRRAHAVHPITALQVEYSPFALDIEKDQVGLLKAARELGVMIVGYSPLGRGLLTGKIRSHSDLDKDDPRHMFPMFSAENFPNIVKVVDGIQAIAEKHSATAGQVALAWLLAQGDDIIPIPGTSRISNLQENMASLKLQLSPEEVAEIYKLAVAADRGLGSIRPGQWQSLCFNDTPELESAE